MMQAAGVSLSSNMYQPDPPVKTIRPPYIPFGPDDTFNRLGLYNTLFMKIDVIPSFTRSLMAPLLTYVLSLYIIYFTIMTTALSISVDFSMNSD